ncbi:hypothetical protein SAMN05444166_2349 [Singulisphaera sp. GP187]|nr:hypothetical protein SAMN05444166_2349 [Singulisphaera sp. GP187]
MEWTLGRMESRDRLTLPWSIRANAPGQGNPTQELSRGSARDSQETGRQRFDFPSH